MRPETNPSDVVVGVFALNGPARGHGREAWSFHCHAVTVVNVRVWELAEELRVESAVVIALLRADGEWVSNHLSTVPEPAIRKILRSAPKPTRPEGDCAASTYDNAHNTTGTPARSLGPRPGSVASQSRWSRRRPGPRKVSFSPPYVEDEDDYYTDPVDQLKSQPVISTRDVAELCGVEMATVRRWVARSYIAPIGRVSSSNTFDTREVLAAFDEICGRRSATRRARARYPNSPIRQPMVTPNEFERMSRVYSNSIIDLDEAAQILGKAPGTLRTWVHRGHLQPHPTSAPRQLKFRISDLHAAARRRRG